MDFNEPSLTSRETIEDIESQQLQLYDGLRCIFYQDHSEDGVRGFLHTVATIQWNSKSEDFEIEVQNAQLQFLAGIDPGILDNIYDD